MAEVIRVSGIWQNDGDYHFTDDAGNHHTGEMNPIELLAAALVSCTGKTMHTIMGRMRIEHKGFTVTGLARFADDEPRRIGSIVLDASIRGAVLSDSQKERLRELGEKHCPISQTLKQSVDIELNIET